MERGNPEGSRGGLGGATEVVAMALDRGRGLDGRRLVGKRSTGIS